MEIGDSEYAYGGNSLIDSTGVYEMFPKKHDIFIFKYSMEVGEIESEDEAWRILNRLMKKYRANKYDMLKMNCNHFTNEFLLLLIGKGLPPHLNRIAYLGSYLHCIVPQKYLIITPDMSNADIVMGSNDSTTISSRKEDEDSLEEESSEDDDLIFEDSTKVDSLSRSRGGKSKVRDPKGSKRSEKNRSCKNRFLKFLKLA